MLNTPVLLLIFNRPDATERVFDEIRRQRPKYLYIAADGPRADHAGDEDLCRQCKAIVSAVDWECEVKTLFRDKNLGCGAAPASAITWFFEQVEEGIILEDDCLPNSSFFTFCETLLQKYRAVPEVMMICGTTYQPEPLNPNTYYFSRYPHVWGWATWRRAWAHYNFKLSGESEAERLSVIRQSFTNSRERKLWMHNMTHIINGLHAWDYQWMYWIWKNKGVCIVPWYNMVSNIGFGPQATHTFDAASVQARMKQHEISDIQHPGVITIHKKADSYERFNILIDPPAAYFFKRFRAAVNRIRSMLSLKSA